MNKSEVLKEFELFFRLINSLCKDDVDIDYMKSIMPTFEQVISDLVDNMEAEKQEAVREIIDFISDQDSIIDSTYKTYELLQSDIEYIKNKYLKE